MQGRVAGWPGQCRRRSPWRAPLCLPRLSRVGLGVRGEQGRAVRPRHAPRGDCLAAPEGLPRFNALSCRGGGDIAVASAGASGMGSKDAPGGGGRGTGWRPRDQQLSQYLKRMMQQMDPPLLQQHRAGMQAFMQRPPSSGSSAASWAGGSIGDGAWSSSSSGSVGSVLGWGGFDMEGHMSGTGIQPGQIHTPMRIGRDQHPLSGLLRSNSLRDPAGDEWAGKGNLRNGGGSRPTTVDS